MAQLLLPHLTVTAWVRVPNLPVAPDPTSADRVESRTMAQRYSAPTTNVEGESYQVARNKGMNPVKPSMHVIMPSEASRMPEVATGRPSR